MLVQFYVDIDNYTDVMSYKFHMLVQFYVDIDNYTDVMSYKFYMLVQFYVDIDNYTDVMSNKLRNVRKKTLQFTFLIFNKQTRKKYESAERENEK